MNGTKTNALAIGGGNGTCCYGVEIWIGIVCVSNALVFVVKKLVFALVAGMKLVLAVVTVGVVEILGSNDSILNVRLVECLNFPFLD